MSLNRVSGVHLCDRTKFYSEIETWKKNQLFSLFGFRKYITEKQNSKNHFVPKRNQSQRKSKSILVVLKMNFACKTSPKSYISWLGGENMLEK